MCSQCLVCFSHSLPSSYFEGLSVFFTSLVCQCSGFVFNLALGSSVIIELFLQSFTHFSPNDSLFPDFISVLGEFVLLVILSIASGQIEVG